jgi:hypothetical protein
LLEFLFVQNQPGISTRVFLWVAQIFLAMLAAALILCMWLPIDGVRDWLIAHWPHH